jgi:hypothetical protein
MEVRAQVLVLAAGEVVAGYPLPEIALVMVVAALPVR